MNIIQNVQMSDGVIVAGNKVIVNGKELPPAPCKGHNSTVINGKVYLDGYEYIDGKWKKTLTAMWHLLF